VFSDYIAHLDGATEIDGGWINHHWVQLGYQIADSVAGFAYAFGGTCIILFIMNLIPGLSLRASEDAEVLGIDDAELGEFAVSSTYVRRVTGADRPQYDYVELTREVISEDDSVPKFSTDNAAGQMNRSQPVEKP
jgi:Amt family ammonium transporter